MEKLYLEQVSVFIEHNYWEYEAGEVFEHKFYK